MLLLTSLTRESREEWWNKLISNPINYIENIKNLSTKTREDPKTIITLPIEEEISLSITTDKATTIVINNNTMIYSDNDNIQKEDVVKITQI